jgi:Skp family chaperone for outer membrane proteins
MIRRFLLSACLAALIVPGTALAQTAAQPASAAAAPATPAAPDHATFLVLDMERVATESSAMKSLTAQMDERRSNEAAAYNMALDQLESEFAPVREQAATMSDEDFQKAKAQFEERQTEIDTVLKSVQDRLNEAADKALDRFNAVATEAGQEVLKSHGADRFVDAANVLYVRKGSGYDVTDDILERVNARLPTLKADIPASSRKAGSKPEAKP